MNLHFRKTPLAMVVAGLALGTVASGQAWAQQARALTPAGTEINNIATVTYEDENGNTYSAQSNESTVTVAKVYGATLEDDNEKTGAPGTTVYFPHVLTNTGNTEDTFTIESLEGVNDENGQPYTVYEDLNGNGLPDAGEPEVTELTLSGGERADLVVAKPVPSNAPAGDTIESTLTVVSDGGGDVVDEGDNGDGLDGTNQDTVTVTDGPVIVPTKQSEVNDDGTITYTLTVKNTGSAAEDVVILDTIPANAEFVSGSVELNGLLSGTDLYDSSTFTNSADIVPINTIDEPTGIDMNGNNINGETDQEGFFFTDTEMGPGLEVSIKFTVEFEEGLEAGTEANNRFVAGEDGDGDGVPDDPESSNETSDEVEQTFGPDASDTGDNTGDDTGTDADGDNDQARVNEAAAGSTVSFTNVITNNGNGDDTFELSIENDAGAGYTGSEAVPSPAVAFPTGTTFTFYNGNDTSPLTDTNGDGNVDTGSLATGESLEITVRAKLPSDASGTGDFVATTTVTSANDPSDSPASDQKLEVLGNITAPSIDLANSFSSELTGSDDADAYDDTAPITTESAGVGDTVTFDLFAANNGGSSDSFVLEADLPEGWNVTFKELGVDTDADGNVDNGSNAGATVTATPLLPAGAVYHYQAEVQISSVTDQALADFEGTVEGIDATDGGADTSISPSDGDGDYPVRFTIESNATNQSDQKLDAVDVDSERNIAVTPSGENQVEPGGSVEYSHEIANRGNTTEDVTLTTENDADGFSNNTQVFVDTTGDGTPDSWQNIANIPDGDVFVRAPDGTPVEVTIDNSGADTVVTLEPGERLDVKTTVFAPANASQGDKDTYTLTATTADGSISDIATDTTEVITGQVRLEKSAYVNTACDCGSEMPYDTTSTNFAAEPEDQVEPGQCVVWNLEARNEGTTEAKNVTINDSVTEFTTLVEADDSTVTAIQNGDDLTWEIGDLASGASASAQFCVKVD
ncbi:DUF11 domain-containing protein [Halomonas sp. BLK-85]